MAIYSIDKNMDDVPVITALYNFILKKLIKDDINDRNTRICPPRS